MDVQTQKIWRTPSHDRCYGFEDFVPDREVEVFFEKIVEDERERVRRDFNESLQQGKPFCHEFKVKHSDGMLHWLFVEGRKIPTSSANSNRFIGTIRDITQRKHSEEAYRRAESEAQVERRRAELARQELYDFFMQAPVALCMLSGPEHLYTLANPKFIETSGRNPVGKTVREAFKAEEVPQFIEILDQVYQTGVAYIGQALPFPRQNEKGEITDLYLDVGYHAFREHDGKIKGILAIVNDVTERVLAQRHLQQVAHDAESANAAKSSFLANMSHEIRTPMTAVLGFSELLRDPSLSDHDRSDALNRIEKSSRSLLRILDDILDISKIEAGRLAIHKATFSPSEVAGEVISFLRLSAEQKGIALKLHLDPSVPMTAFSDAARIRQILVNLIGNAIKFTFQGEVVVQMKSEDSAFLIFKVRDTGIGITPKDQEKLFQPFAQADGSITRNFGGTGLGLLLSRRLCEGLRGHLSLTSSAPGAGSTFTARIEAAPFGSKALATASNSRGLSLENKLSGLRILLAEDVPDNQVLMQKYLVSSGAEVMVANNGQEALEKAENHNFDLILMDIQMPVVDGIQATRRLRSKGFQKPILALTAHALKEEVQKTSEAGCNGHLTKPISRTQLIEAIGRSMPQKTL